MSRGQHQEQWVPEQGRRVQVLIVVAGRGADEGDVQAALAQALELRGRLLVVESDMDAGAVLAQGPQGGGQDAGVHRVGDVTDAQAALLAPAEAPAQVLQSVRVPQQGTRLGQENPAVGGEPDALLAAFEQGESQVLLQLGDLPAERRLGDVQALGGTADVFVLGHGDEVAQLSQVKHVGPRRTQVCPSKSWTVSCRDPNLEHARPTDRPSGPLSVRTTITRIPS